MKLTGRKHSNRVERLYFLNYGPDYSHVGLNTLVFDKLKDARSHLARVDLSDMNSGFYQIVRQDHPTWGEPVNSKVIATNFN